MCRTSTDSILVTHRLVKNQKAPSPGVGHKNSMWHPFWAIERVCINYKWWVEEATHFQPDRKKTKRQTQCCKYIPLSDQGISHVFPVWVRDVRSRSTKLELQGSLVSIFGYWYPVLEESKGYIVLVMESV